MTKRKATQVLVQGAIKPDKIAAVIANHQTKTAVGAHEIFLGQVRADEIEGKTIKAIEFSAYPEMAIQILAELRESVFEKFEITCLHMYHSQGKVTAGEVCFFVMTSSSHRLAAREATRYLVERIKADVPIFGKEIFEDDSHTWKHNN